MTDQQTLYTIGHSNRSLEDFLALLTQYGIQRLVDVRLLPGSKKYPHFNQETLEAALKDKGVDYVHMKALGGRRTPVKDSINMAWQNKAFRGYADYMQTGEFSATIGELVHLSQEKTTTVMCSEAVPWRCHRALIGDAMLVRGFEVLDIISPTSLRPHKLIPWAKAEGQTITYPAEAVQTTLPIGNTAENS